MKKIILVFSLIASAFLDFAYAQDSYKRTVGLAANIQQSDVGIQIPIWIENKITIAPFVSAKYISAAGTDYTFGVIPKFYINMDKLSPYIGLKFGVLMANPSDQYQESTADYVGGIAFGGDYFFDPRFSIGVEAQLNISESDENSSRFGNNGGSIINTGMAVTASVYFGK
jgi:hypothetical protein